MATPEPHVATEIERGRAVCRLATVSGKQLRSSAACVSRELVRLEFAHAPHEGELERLGRRGALDRVDGEQGGEERSELGVVKLQQLLQGLGLRMQKSASAMAVSRETSVRGR